jgi:hypothetical protein
LSTETLDSLIDSFDQDLDLSLNRLLASASASG